MFKVLSILESAKGVFEVNLDPSIGVLWSKSTSLSDEKAFSILSREFSSFLIATFY